MKYFFIGLFLILASLFLLEYYVVGQAVYGDGRYYWGVTRSLYFSRDIDVSDEMSHLYSPENNNKEVFFGVIPSQANKTKFVTGGFSLGVSVMWLPFYFLADTLVVFLRSLGVHTVRNGYSDIYQIIVGLGNIFFVVSGVFLLFRILRRIFSTKVVITSLILLVFATNLLYYSGIDVINSHPFSFFGSTLLLWFFVDYERTLSNKSLFFQGVVGGLLMANRTQDALLMLLPLCGVYLFQKKKTALLYLGRKYIVFLVGLVIGYLPQLLILAYGQGHLALSPHTQQPYVFPPQYLGILFDTKLGVFFYMPVFLVGLLGLIFLYKRNRVYTLLFGLVIFITITLLASWQGWHQASYSMRYFISLMPMVAFGLAEVVHRLVKRYSLAFVSSLVVLLVLHELFMIVGFKLFLQDPTNVGAELSRSGKVKTMILRQLEPATQYFPFR